MLLTKAQWNANSLAVSHSATPGLAGRWGPRNGFQQLWEGMVISVGYSGLYAGARLLGRGAVLVVIDGGSRLSFQISSLFPSTHKSFPSGKSNQSNWSYRHSYLGFHFSIVLTLGKALTRTFRTKLAVVQTLCSAYCLSGLAHHLSFLTTRDFSVCH